MRRKLASILIVLILTSCNSNTDIEGDWILAYTTQDWEETKIYYDYCSFLKIEGNNHFVKDCANPNIGISSIEKTHPIKKNNGKRYIYNPMMGILELKTVNSDSLVFIDSDSLQRRHYVFKRLNPKNKSTEWAPSGRNYSFVGNNGPAYWDFTNDSLMLEYSDQQKSFETKKWWFEKFDNYNYIVLHQPSGPQPILIDSVKMGKAFLSTYDIQVNNYTMEEYHYNSNIIDSLIGSWEITDLIVGSKIIPRPPESLIFQFEKFEVSKDSINAGINDIPFKIKWKLAGNQKTILFPANNSRLLRHWKILEMTDKKLILDMPDIFIHDTPGLWNTNKVTRIYKKTKGINTYSK